MESGDLWTSLSGTDGATGSGAADAHPTVTVLLLWWKFCTSVEVTVPSGRSDQPRDDYGTEGAPLLAHA